MFAEQWAQFGETITQAVGFLILFWAMKKWAWGPLQDTLEKRQSAVEDGFVKIERRQAEADKLRDDYQARLKDIENEARAKIQEAVNDGRRVAAELTDNARREADSIRVKAEQTIRHEVAKARIELRDEIVSLTLKSTEKLMRAHLDDAADRKLVGSFVDDLQGKTAPGQSLS